MKGRFLVDFVCMILLVSAAGCGRGEEAPVSFRGLRVAAAANIRPALDRIVDQFEARHPDVHVTVAYGSSGSHYVQIVNGGPWDVFFSADTSYPRQLRDAGLTLGNPVHYATGRLVLWTRKERGFDLTPGVQLVADSRVKRIAIANPAFAPYGAAAEQAMRSAGVEGIAASKLVLGENVAQAAQFVDSGAADIGFIALSLALSPALSASGAWAEIPGDLHQPIDQDAVLLRSTENPELGREFLGFVTGPESASAWSEMGYVTRFSAASGSE